MKREHLLNVLCGTLLGLWAAAGSVGCLVTAFDLSLEHPQGLFWGGMLFAALCALLFQWKRGGLVLLCLGALAAGYVWHRGVPAEPFLSLFARLTELYDLAYGWGAFPAAPGPVDLPMALAGGLIILTVTRSVCRGTGAALPLLTALLLFTPCIVVTDTVPEIPWLFLLGTGLALLALTAGVRKTNPLQGDRLAAMAAIPVLLGAGLLFWLNPQESYVNRAKEIQQSLADRVAELPNLVENTAAAISGQADSGRQVSLSTLGRRIERKITVMEVTSETGGILYLRGRDYDSYDGKGWLSTQNRQEPFSGAGAVVDTVTVRTWNTETLLYLPYYPAEAIHLVGGRATNQESVMEYIFSVSTLTETAERESPDKIVAGVGSPEEPDLQRYLTLPIEAAAGLRAVLSTIDTSGTHAETAAAIGNYVRGRAKYDRNPSRMPEEEPDFVRWFVTEAERGYCVHFASAATVLLRAAGIPARYVTGYMVATQPGTSTKVTGEHAHAWAEYYDPQRSNWVVLEATPPEDEETAGSGGTETTEGAETRPSPTQQPRPTEPEVPGQTDTTLPGPTQPEKTPRFDLSWLGGLAKWLLGLAGLAAILEAQRQARIRLRRQNRGSPNARALARWREGALLAKLLKEPPPRELHQLAQKAKFSQHTLTEEELSSFDNYLRTACRRLKALPWYQRLVHQYIFAAY